MADAIPWQSVLMYRIIRTPEEICLKRPHAGRSIVTDMKAGAMGLYSELYDFAASAGSFEGYVYHHKDMDTSYLPKWSGHLAAQYNALPDYVRAEIQHMCNGTLGRAVRSLEPILGADHEVIENLKSCIKGELPKTPDDFEKH